ncbi:GTPase domain-containing protein [Paenibacillus odorifer]|uniref:GTPase domain-containing protein n=1 Tax=Paenibacillus odorifer TaxID=189426 RepID=UPI0004F7F9C9|nr:GTPase domain-containing protein [Paenibacillus odorifer]AIQ73004.1 hypothetical protein PODO_06910 [Paenibacillus odorifer]
MKQLIVGLIGETGSGKSTFCSMCSSEDIHPIISGSYGKKGTTKSTKRMIFSKEMKNFDLNEFSLSYKGGQTEFGLPLSEEIDLHPFESLTILDTQGLNDWKSDEERERTNKSILKVCDEADIILVTIPEGGNVVTTNTVLNQIFTQFCHKPIVFVYRAQQSREKLLKKEKSIPLLIPFVEDNIEKYSKINPKLGNVIKCANLPADTGVYPLFCILPNSEELSSDIEENERQSDNTVLRKYISNALQYAINLQNLLINEMADEYVKSNLEIISTTIEKIFSLENIISGMTNVKGLPLYRPYIKNFNFKPEYDIEYSWQGGTPWMYPVCGGDYTYASNDIYVNLCNIIRNSNESVAVKSSLLSVLYSISEDRHTPGSLNLRYNSYTRGVPVNWLIDIRTELLQKSPELFEEIDIYVDDNNFFDNPAQCESLLSTDEKFRVAHHDWNKCLKQFYFFTPEKQKIIKQKFSDREWSATVLVSSISKVINKIDFCRGMNEKNKDDFEKIAFDSRGKCVLWNNEV